MKMTRVNIAKDQGDCLWTSLVFGLRRGVKKNIFSLLVPKQLFFYLKNDILWLKVDPFFKGGEKGLGFRLVLWSRLIHYNMWFNCQKNSPTNSVKKSTLRSPQALTHTHTPDPGLGLTSSPWSTDEGPERQGNGMEEKASKHFEPTEDPIWLKQISEYVFHCVGHKNGEGRWDRLGGKATLLSWAECGLC